MRNSARELKVEQHARKFSWKCNYTYVVSKINQVRLKENEIGGFSAEMKIHCSSYIQLNPGQIKLQWEFSTSVNTLVMLCRDGIGHSRVWILYVLDCWKWSVILVAYLFSRSQLEFVGCSEFLVAMYSSIFDVGNIFWGKYEAMLGLSVMLELYNKLPYILTKPHVEWNLIKFL